MPTSRYLALKKITHSGVDYPAGSPLALSDAFAAPLLSIGAIVADSSGPLPSMPVSQGDVLKGGVDAATGDEVTGYVKYTKSAGGVEFDTAGKSAVLAAAGIPAGGGRGEIGVGDSITMYCHTGAFVCSPTSPHLAFNCWKPVDDTLWVVTTATLRWDATMQTLTLQRSGESEGPPVSVRSGFNRVYSSGGSGLLFGVKMDKLPTSNASYSLSIAITPTGYSFATNSWAAWGAFMSSDPLVNVGNHGIGSDQSYHVLARMDQVLSGDEYGNPYAFPVARARVMLGTNDILFDRTASAAFSDILRVVKTLQEHGIAVEWITPPASTGLPAARKKELIRLVRMIREYCRTDRRITFVDAFAATRNPATDCDYRANFNSDSVHLTSAGAFAIGKALADARAAYGAIGGRSRMSISDPDMLHPYGAMTGTGGQLDAGASGELADNWRLGRNGANTGTLVASKLTNTSDLERQVIDITADSSTALQGYALLDKLSVQLGSFSPPLVVGDRIYVESEIELANSTNVRNVTLEIRFRNSGGTVLYQTSSLALWTADSYANDVAVRGVQRTPIAKIPPGCTNITICVITNMLVNGGVKETITSIDLRKVG